MDEKISKVEIELLSAAIDRIVMQEVLEDELLGTLPKVDELNDSNKIYRGKVSSPYQILSIALLHVSLSDMGLLQITHLMLYYTKHFLARQSFSLIWYF